jgi:hypothetical protein
MFWDVLLGRLGRLPPPRRQHFPEKFSLSRRGAQIFEFPPPPPPQPDSVRYGPVRQFSTCYVQTISDLLEQLVDSLLASSAHQPCYMQDMMTTCSRLVNNWEQVMRTHLVDKLWDFTCVGFFTCASFCFYWTNHSSRNSHVITCYNTKFTFLPIPLARCTAFSES